ncbi:MAG: phosphate ABC transporter permease subunit PstC [Clostridia bacterium]|nr:phosphate ABC transporter permease subunit PstC [Clostridia bacterium]
MKTNAFREKAMRAVFLSAACVSVLAVLLISLFLFGGGFPGMAKIGFFEFLFGQIWKPMNGIFGILPMILGSIYITGYALLLGTPVALLTAIYLARFCPQRLYRVLKPAVSLLAGIPSVVYGFFGLIVIVPTVRQWFGGNGYSLLSGSTLLAMMILPTVITVTEAALRAVPETYYEAALALGAPHERAVFFVQLPAAKSGVLAGIVLGAGRAIGETTAVAMVIGNQARMPAGLVRGLRTLTTNVFLEMGYSADLHREALVATAVVLFVFILLINLFFGMLKRRMLA